jgi:hypothetical protein
MADAAASKAAEATHVGSTPTFPKFEALVRFDVYVPQIFGDDNRRLYVVRRQRNKRFWM